jgi:hypothetical protein
MCDAGLPTRTYHRYHVTVRDWIVSSRSGGAVLGDPYPATLQMEVSCPKTSGETQRST